MSRKYNQVVNKAVLRLLTWLGIGSASMLFMACYGPAPTGYQVIDEEDSIVVMEGDSVAMTINNAANEANLTKTGTTAVEE